MFRVSVQVMLTIFWLIIGVYDLLAGIYLGPYKSWKWWCSRDVYPQGGNNYNSFVGPISGIQI